MNIAILLVAMLTSFTLGLTVAWWLLLLSHKDQLR